MKRYINYKEDFSVCIRFIDKYGQRVSIPSDSWKIVLRTAKYRRPFVAQKYNDKRIVNSLISEDGSAIIVVASGHGLCPGNLNIEMEYYVSESVSETGCRLRKITQPTRIELVSAELTSCGDTTPIDVLVTLWDRPNGTNCGGESGYGGNTGVGDNNSDNQYATDGDLENVFGDVFGSCDNSNVANPDNNDQYVTEDDLDDLFGNIFNPE